MNYIFGNSIPVWIYMCVHILFRTENCWGKCEAISSPVSSCDKGASGKKTNRNSMCREISSSSCACIVCI